MPFLAAAPHFIVAVCAVHTMMAYCCRRHCVPNIKKAEV
jgi:hypothetical protein